MKRTLLLSACVLGLAACQDGTLPSATPAAAPAPRGASATLLDPELERALAGALPTDRLVVIVNYDETLTTDDDLSAAVRGLGAQVIRLKHLSMALALGTPDQVRAIAGVSGVQGVYDDGQDRLLMRESVATIRADQVWAAGFTGKGVGVAIMDSGINGLNPDVGYPGKTVQNVKFGVRLEDFAEDDGTPRPAGGLYVENVTNTDNSSGHGTHVAGTAAGSGGTTNGAYRGVAPGAHLVGLSVGEGLSILNSSVILAADWLVENAARYNVQVVNNSWGSNGTFDPADPVNEAMSSLYHAGITVVFAAGNEGPAENTLNRRSANPHVISVAAGCKVWVLDPSNSQSQCGDGRDRVLANFSSRGIPGDPLYAPDITAPGVRIVSTRSPLTVMSALDASSDVQSCNIGVQNIEYYTCASGTSMASPHIAGVVALMEEASGGRLTPDQALRALKRTARPLLGYGEWEVGAGYADALAAVRAVRR